MHPIRVPLVILTHWTLDFSAILLTEPWAKLFPIHSHSILCHREAQKNHEKHCQVELGSNVAITTSQPSLGQFLLPSESLFLFSCQKAVIDKEPGRGS